VRFPCVHAVTTTPAQRLGCCFALSPSHISLPRNGGRVGLCNDLFEACSVFTHVTACTLAGSPEVIRYIEGFSYFVTSITAPIASGWSDITGWDSHPLENAALARRTPLMAIPQLGISTVGMLHMPSSANGCSQPTADKRNPTEAGS